MREKNLNFKLIKKRKEIEEEVCREIIFQKEESSEKKTCSKKIKKSGNGFNLSCPRFVTKIKMYNS